MAAQTEYLDSAEVKMMYVSDQQAAAPADIPSYQLMNRPSFAHLEVDLSGGKRIVANAGALLWKHGNVKMETDCYGGLGDAVCRSHCAGETCCQNKYTGSSDGGPSKVAFGFDLPGDMLAFQVTPQAGWMVSTQSFIAGSETVHVSAKWPGCKTALCGGEGLFLTHVYCDPKAQVGYFFAGDYGALQRHVVAPGKTFWVNAGLFFACSDDTPLDVAIASGFKTCCCGQEGFVLVFKGPATVYTQNRNPAIIKKILNPMPVPSGGGGDNKPAGGGAGGGGSPH